MAKQRIFTIIAYFRLPILGHLDNSLYICTLENIRHCIMKHNNNPFPIKGYVSAEFFCDREKESIELLSNIENGVDTTLISPRKYGKTGLILHVFNLMRQQKMNYETIYVDIYATLSLEDFVKEMAEAILEHFPMKTSMGEKFMQVLRGIRTMISYDVVTGEPEIEFGYTTPAQKEHTLKTLFSFLNEQSVPVVLAIDEFQQIAEYEEKNVEATLRTLTQQMHNICFIYCGSNRRTLSEMFLDANRPFFSSTKTMTLHRIDNTIYRQFIKEKFEERRREIDDDALDYIMEWTCRHTFYTQSLCNEIFATAEEHVTLDLTMQTARSIIERESSGFLQIRKLVTAQQWRILIAVASEESVSQLTSAAFLSKYNIGSATNCRRGVESLTEKELILETLFPTGKSYRIYNVFLSRWLKEVYGK